MAREASVTYEQIKAVADELHASGNAPSARVVRQRLGNVGSMGTINKGLQKWRDEVDEHDSAAPRALPMLIQRPLFGFIDQEVAKVHEALEEELSMAKREKPELANDNERLGDRIGALMDEIVSLSKERAVMEGRICQLADDLAAARQDAAHERENAGRYRIQLAIAEQRIDIYSHVDRENASLRESVDAHREARVRAEQAVAVLQAQKTHLEQQLHEIKGTGTTSPDQGKRPRKTGAQSLPVVQAATPRRRRKAESPLPAAPMSEVVNLPNVPLPQHDDLPVDTRQMGLC
jgi:hypothetical protein